ncbi:hypothetical protein [Lutimonas sp.]|uniref:hypothetical protein n=1 Tax=Lutimonas sp. TaxID=1872403 RepID=UPI003D9B1367
MYNILQKYFSSLVFLVKVIIIAGAYYIISEKLLHDSNFQQIAWTERMSVLGPWGVMFLIGILFLSLFNWILEIFKWQSLVDLIHPISFRTASKQSLASLTASLITPNRVGEYGAKAAFFQKKHRPKVLLLNFISNSYQMLITILLGTIGLFFLRDYIAEIQFQVTTFYGIAGIMVAMGMGWVFIYKKWTKWIEKLWNDFKSIPQSIHKKTLLFSLGRYFVFSHQFYFFLLFFGVDIDYFVALPVIYSMYLIASIIPGFVLFDWLVKGSVAVTLFGYFGVHEIVVLSITASMWILNFAVPAMIGSFYVITFKAKSFEFNESKVLK